MGNAKSLDVIGGRVYTDNEGRFIKGLIHDIDFKEIIRMREQSNAQVVMNTRLTRVLETTEPMIFEHRVVNNRCELIDFMGEVYVLSPQAKIGAVIKEALLSVMRAI